MDDVSMLRVLMVGWCYMLIFVYGWNLFVVYLNRIYYLLEGNTMYKVVMGNDNKVSIYLTESQTNFNMSSIVSHYIRRNPLVTASSKSNRSRA